MACVPWHVCDGVCHRAERPPRYHLLLLQTRALLFERSCLACLPCTLRFRSFAPCASARALQSDASHACNRMRLTHAIRCFWCMQSDASHASPCAVVMRGQVFRVFFEMFLGIVIFGGTHGLVRPLAALALSCHLRFRDSSKP